MRKIDKWKMFKNWLCAAAVVCTGFVMMSEEPTERIVVEAVIEPGQTTWEVVEDTAAMYGDVRTMQEIMADAYRANEKSLGAVMPGDRITVALEVKR